MGSLKIPGLKYLANEICLYHLAQWLGPNSITPHFCFTHHLSRPREMLSYLAKIHELYNTQIFLTWSKLALRQLHSQLAT